MGLADGFGDTDTIARDVIKARDIVDFSVKESLTDRVARRIGASIGIGAVGAAMHSGLQMH
jgi:protease-4